MRATKAIHGRGRGKRKYTVIAKVKDCNEYCGFKFVKYRSNNEQRIINFLKHNKFVHVELLDKAITNKILNSNMDNSRYICNR